MRAEPPVPPAILDAIRAPFLDGDTDLVDPPVIQPLNELLDLAGEAMRARLFIVQDEGGREACLRPDFTLAVARAQIAAGGGPARRRYEGKAFRVAPRGGGAAHPEEFLQLGLEAFGQGTGPKADAAMVGLAWRAATAGGREDLALRLGDIGLIKALLDGLETPPAAAARILRGLGRIEALRAALHDAREPAGARRDGLAAKLAGMEQDRAEAALTRAWTEDGLGVVGGRTAAEIVTRLREGAAQAGARRMSREQTDLIAEVATIHGPPAESLARVRAVFTAADIDPAAVTRAENLVAAIVAEGVPEGRATFDVGFQRPFAYYNGLLFDITSDALAPDQTVAAGGRYDHLIGQLGGEANGDAIGCMVRPHRAWKEGAR